MVNLIAMGERLLCPYISLELTHEQSREVQKDTLPNNRANPVLLFLNLERRVSSIMTAHNTQFRHQGR